MLTGKFNVAGQILNFDAGLCIGASKNISSGILSAVKDAVFTVVIDFWSGLNPEVAATLTGDSVGDFVETGFIF